MRSFPLFLVTEIQTERLECSTWQNTKVLNMTVLRELVESGPLSLSSRFPSNLRTKRTRI